MNELKNRVINEFKNHLSMLVNIISLLIKGNRHKARRKALEQYSFFLKKFYKLRKHDGVSVMNEDWDYLVILDACRYDCFEKKSNSFCKGQLQKKISMASSTSEWVLKNYKNYYEDTIYVSSNPHISDYEVEGFKGTDHFFRVEHVWKHSWNDELDTVPASEVTKAALKMKNLYPDKRMLIHYLQPHGPWIGETKILIHDIGKEQARKNKDKKWTLDKDVWKLVREGRFPLKKLKQGYVSNLEYVLDEVKKLVDQLDGKVIISSDHGEALGEKLVFGHPSRIYIKELVAVPWFFIDRGKKNDGDTKAKNFKSQDNENDDTDEKILIKRLKALGYM